MKTPRQTQETAQISASNDRSMVGQGEVDKMLEMPQGLTWFPFYVSEDYCGNSTWIREKKGMIRVRHKIGLIIFTKELVVWSICDLQESVI